MGITRKMMFKGLMLLSFLFYAFDLRADLVDDLDELGDETSEKVEKDPKAEQNIDKKDNEPKTSSSSSKVKKPKSKATKPKSGSKDKKTKIISTSPEPKSSDNRKKPITYKADEVLSFQDNGKSSTISLSNNVFIKQGSLTLRSDFAKIWLNPKVKGDQSIDKITISGNVTVQKSAVLAKDKVSAKGDKAVFANKARTVTLSGNAVVIKGDQIVRGNKVVYNLKNGQIAISGAKGTLKPERLTDEKQ